LGVKNPLHRVNGHAVTPDAILCYRNQGIPKQPGTGQIVRLIAFFSGYFVFKNENVKEKVKYGFVLYTGLPFAV
jgi:hypothetical protein